MVRTLERGDKTKEGEDAVILSSADRGFVLKENWIKIQRAVFQPGTKESFITNWMEAHKKADVEIHSISTPDESDQVLVTAVLPEEIILPVCRHSFLSRKSETYQNCLPLTALRSDSGGDHRIRTPQTKLRTGNRMGHCKSRYNSKGKRQSDDVC